MGYYYKFKAWYRQRHPGAFVTKLPEKLFDGGLIVYVDMCLVLMGLADRFGCRSGMDGLLVLLSVIYRAFGEMKAPAVVLFWDESEYVTVGKAETQDERDAKTVQRHGRDLIDSFEANHGATPMDYGPLPLPWDLYVRNRDRRRRVFRWFAEKIVEHMGVPEGKSVVLDRPPGFSHPVVVRDVAGTKRVEPFRSGANPKIGESDFKPFYYMHSVFPDKNGLIYSVDADTVSIAMLERGHALGSSDMLPNEVWIKSMDREERFEIDDNELLHEFRQRGWSKYVKLEEDLKRQRSWGEPPLDAFAPENAYKRKFFSCKHEEFIDANELWRARLGSYESRRASFLASEMFVVLLTGNDMSGSSCLPGVGEMWLFELWMSHRDQIGPILHVDPRMYVDESAPRPVPDFVAAWKLVRLAYQQKLSKKIGSVPDGELLPYSRLVTYGPLKVGKHTLQVPTKDEVRLLFARTLYALVYYSTGWGGGDKEPDALSADPEGRSILGWELIDKRGPRERENVRVVPAERLSHALVDDGGADDAARVRFVKPLKKQFDDAESNPFSQTLRKRTGAS